MYMIFFAIGVKSISETDCFNFNDMHANELFNVEEITDDIINITYLSKRFRKKFSLDLCGDSLQADIQLTDTKLGNSTSIFVSHEVGSNVSLVNMITSGINASGKANFTSQYNQCLSIISGRGYVGAFVRPNDGSQDPVFLESISLPRKINVSFLLNKNRPLSKLCVGDFLGESRMKRPTNIKWNSHFPDL